jgi:hypothetical protein
VAWSEQLWALAGAWLAAAGSSRPETDARALLAYGDGLLLDRLVRGGSEEFAPEPSLAAFLRALIQ